MANYKFQNINAGVSMQSPSITVASVHDNMDGTAAVEVKISLGAPQADAATFKVTLDNLFPYAGDQPMKTDVDTWVATELVNYEV